LHISVSVGWIGAVVAYLALVIAATRVDGDQVLRAAWISMDLIGWYAIVPLALAAFLTGLMIALGTPWGLFRHSWVLVSLLLTGLATGVLLGHMPTVSSFAAIAADSAIVEVPAILGPALRGELLHAGLGLLVLLAIAAINVYKPRGLTAHGRRHSQRVADSAHLDTITSAPVPASVPRRTPRWVYAVWIHAAVLLVLLAIMHVRGGGPGVH
jgi:hypothetical protein